MDAAGSRTAARCRCSRSWARQRAPRGAAGAGATYDVEWVDIDEPDVEYPYTPGQPAPTTNDTALTTSRARAGRRVRRTSPGSRARSTTTASSTSPPPRAAGRPRPDRRRPDPTASARGFGQVWAYDTAGRRSCACVYQSPDRDDARLPGQHHHLSAARSWSARTTSSDNFIRGLSQDGQALGHRAEPAAEQHRRATGPTTSSPGSTFSPDGQHPVRQHPGVPRADVRDLGAVAVDRGLSGRGAMPRWSTPVFGGLVVWRLRRWRAGSNTDR